MAESANPPHAPVAEPAAPATPAPAPVAAPRARKDNAFLKSLAKFLTETTFLVLGLGFILAGVLVKLHPGLVPGFLKPTVSQLFPHLPYFVVGIGLFFLGWARSMATQALIADARKNRNSPHAWKIPLVSFQAVLFHMAWLFYAVPVGLGGYPPVLNLMGLVWTVFFFLLYALWYVTAHVSNRMPAIAGLRMAIVTVVLSVFADFLWWFQLVFPAILVGMLGIVSLLIAILMRVKKVEQVGDWPKVTLLAVSVVFLAHVTYNALPFGNPTADLMNLTLATKSIPGEVQDLGYYSKDNHNGNKIAFSQKADGGWILQIINPENSSLPVFKIPAGEGEFRSIFIKNGKSLFADMVRDGDRGLWKVDVGTGKAAVLERGIQPIEDGIPWSEIRGQFLYVTQSDGRYSLKVFTLATRKSKTLLTSENPIHTPSWVPPLNPRHNSKGIYPEEKIAYADGAHGLFYVLDVKDGEKEPFLSEAERSLGEKFVPEGKAQKVVPAPDGFRYLYLAQKDKKTQFWLVLADGTKRWMVYQTNASIAHLAWHPDGQRIVFEEIHPGIDHGFFKTVSTAKILDANWGTWLDILPPQISTSSPAIASDGVKVAFVAGAGLWYPSEGQGIWVAALR